MKKTKVILSKLTEADLNRAVLYDNFGFMEYGVIARLSKDGIWAHFGMNEEPLFLRGKDIYFVKF